MSETHFFSREQLEHVVKELLTASGSPAEEAMLVSRHLVNANVVGHPSHGVWRTAMYLDMVAGGLVKPGAVPEIEVDSGATVLLQGHHGFGQVVASRGAEIAIERAQAHGVAAVGMVNLGHLGRLADYVVRITEAGCAAVMFTSTGGGSYLVAPFGGTSRRMGTNPLAIAVPSDSEFPIVLDMATSVFAEGKVRVMVDSDRSAPEKTLLNKDGEPTVDPSEFYEGGAILPLGGDQGYKGYLLNFMVEALAGLLTGSGFIGREERPQFSNCTMMIAIDVSRFRELAAFKRDLTQLVSYLKSSPVAEGQEVLYPGEVEQRQEARIEKTGIPLPGKTVENLQKRLDRAGIEIQLAAIARK